MDIYILKERVSSQEKLKELASKKLQKFYDLWFTKAEPDSDLELYQKAIKAFRVTSSYVKFKVFDFKFKLKASIYPSQKSILLRTYLLTEDAYNATKLKALALPQFDMVMDELLNVKLSGLPITGNFNKEYIDMLLDFYEDNNRLELQ